MLFKRNLDLICDIFKKEYTINELAKKYNISDRMLRYDIDEINLLFSEYFNIELIEIKNSNINTLISKREYNEYILKLPIDIYTLSTDEREYLMILDILLFYNKFKLQEMSEIYLVSKSTIRQNLKNISDNFEKYKLQLLISSSIDKGYKLVAKEIDIRKFLINHIRSGRNLIRNNLFIRKMIESRIKKFSCVINLSESKKVMLDFLNEYDFNINDEAFEIVSYYLFISKNRNYQGYCVEDVENSKFLINTKEYNYVKSKINNTYLIENDLILLTDFLIGLYNFNKNYSFFANWVLTEQLVFNILKKISDEFNIDFTKDKILVNEFLHHIKPAIYRMKNNLKLSESIVDQVIAELGDIYFKVKKALIHLGDILNIELDADEIAFITIMIKRSINRNSQRKTSNTPKVLIVCGFGYSSSKLISENLTDKFYVEVVDTIPYNKLQNYEKLKEIDLVITTLDFTLNTHDIIKVNAIFTEDDILKLANYGLVKRSTKISEKELLNFIEKNKDLSKEELKLKIREKFKNYIYEDADQPKYKKIYEFLNENNTLFKVKSKNLEEVLDKVKELMVSNKYTNENYINTLKMQINKYGSYIQIGEKTILPHGKLNVDVLKTGFVLITLKEPIEFFESKISIIIALASKSIEEHRIAILDINKCMKDDKFEYELENLENFKQLDKLLKSKLQKVDINENS